MIMDRNLQNKAQTAEACPQCGGPLTDFSCRYVPMGQWCRQYGLKQDPRTIMHPSPDPLRQIIEETKEVKRATQAYEQAASEDERATNVWRQAAVAYYNAKAARMNGSQTVWPADGGEPYSVYPDGYGDAQMAQLEALQE
jgi:hypothetical protein